MSLDLQISKAVPAHVQIERHLRQQIESGALPPGERLPTNHELARKWRTSCTAVQRALASLTTAGLIARAPRRGTYVKSHAETATIGILFGPSLSDETGHFYRAVHKAVRKEVGDRGCTCRMYDGLTETHGTDRTHCAQVQRQLIHDLGNVGFKGLIEFSPDNQWPREISANVHLPKAVWNTTRQQTDLQFDMYSFAHESVRFLAGKGRRRMAFFRTRWHSSERSEDFDGFVDAIRELSLPQPMIEEHLLTRQGALQEQEIHERSAQMVRDWRSSSTMPDALVVNDDVAMRSVALALIQGGVKVPDELMVVTFANQGVHLHYGIPVVRYSFSTTEVARQLVDLVWKRMTGETLPPLPVKIQGHIENMDA